MRSLRAMLIRLAEPEDLVNMLDRPFLCKKVGLMNLGGRTLAAAGSVRSEHWKRIPNPPAHSAKVPPSLELTRERRTVPAELLEALVPSDSPATPPP